jgi:hypothetical protein
VRFRANFYPCEKTLGEGKVDIDRIAAANVDNATAHRSRRVGGRKVAMSSKFRCAVLIQNHKERNADCDDPV